MAETQMLTHQKLLNQICFLVDRQSKPNSQVQLTQRILSIDKNQKGSRLNTEEKKP